MKFRQRTDFFVAKIANPQKRQIFNFCTFKIYPKSPIFPIKPSNFAKITHFFFGDFSKSNFVGDFCKKVVANLKPKIADLAKNRQSWQHWHSTKTENLIRRFGENVNKNFRPRERYFFVYTFEKNESPGNKKHRIQIHFDEFFFPK